MAEMTKFLKEQKGIIQDYDKVNAKISLINTEYNGSKKSKTN